VKKGARGVAARALFFDAGNFFAPRVSATFCSIRPAALDVKVWRNARDGLHFFEGNRYLSARRCRKVSPGEEAFRRRRPKKVAFHEYFVVTKASLSYI
jgi:hypothetical protein